MKDLNLKVDIIALTFPGSCFPDIVPKEAEIVKEILLKRRDCV